MFFENKSAKIDRFSLHNTSLLNPILNSAVGLIQSEEASSRRVSGERGMGTSELGEHFEGVCL